MKTALDCFPCYLRQTLQAARVATDDQSLHFHALQKVAELIADMDLQRTPPENSIAVYRKISEICNCFDPYLEAKQESNEHALSFLPECKKIMAEGEDSLAIALRFAIGGNIIDYGAMRSFDVDAAMENCLTTTFAIDHSDILLGHIRALSKDSTVLYLADNSGEIVYDSLVINELAQIGLKVIVAVKSGPIINDALLADAKACGIDTIARIIENGTQCPGTPLGSCSDELQKIFAEADLIISKGQGNFETLSEVEAEIFFLLTVKCSVVGVHLAEISTTPVECLPGTGELVLFHHKAS